MTSDLAQRLTRRRFPRSAGYDPRRLVDNWMGPNPLWLMEWLCAALADAGRNLGFTRVVATVGSGRSS